MKPGETKPSRRSRGAEPLADLVGGLMDPILKRKAGMTTGLIAAWPEIAGAKLAGSTRPEKLLWPARRSDLDAFEPATLVIACEAAASLRLQHQTGELLARVNAFFGFAAVERIKIVQKSVNREAPNRKPTLRDLRPDDREAIDAMVAGVDDPRLSRALRAFAEASLRRTESRKDE